MSWLDTKPAEAVEDAVAQLVASDHPDAAEVRDYAGGDTRFAVWLLLVNKRCATVLGLRIFDLEDWRWRDAYDDGFSPKEAFIDFAEEYGYLDED